jgi:5-methylcytosine-specific restriction endonuclease McrA
LSKRKAHKVANGGSHTAEQLRYLLKRQRNRCHYCKSKLIEWHQEHRIPLSRGGTDNIENIVISCPPCNWRKRDKTEEEFYAFLSDIKTPA